MRRGTVGLLVAGGLGLGAAGFGLASAGEMDAYTLGDKRTGYTFLSPATRSVQDDDFENPAFIWVDAGADLWGTVEGAAGKSCESCHGNAEATMKGVRARFPAYFEPWGKLMNLEQRINTCRTENMKATPWKWESRELLAMTTYVGLQSRGMPVAVKIDGPAKPFFDQGKAFYEQRRGQLDMACWNCHEQYPDTMIRANRLSQGMNNGFPLYRLKWQKLGSLHRRFRGCNKQVRAIPYKAGSDEDVNLELYVTWRGQGLPVETPAVRM